MDHMVFDCPTWRSSFDGAHGKVTCLTGFHRQSRDTDFQKMLDSVRWGQPGADVVSRINETWASAFDCPVTKMRMKKNAVLDINTWQLEKIQTPERTCSNPSTSSWRTVAEMATTG